MHTSDNRSKLLTAGRHLIHAHGYEGSGVRAIAAAAGLPHSSFASHFDSKEAFGLEILEIHYAEHYQLIRTTLRNDALSPQLRLRRYFDALLSALDDGGAGRGCLFGNLCAEGPGASQLIRSRLSAMLLQIQRSLAYCLSAAHAAGALPPHSEVGELAGFITATLQGAILLAKTRRDTAPLRDCQRQLLQMLQILQILQMPVVLDVSNL